MMGPAAISNGSVTVEHWFLEHLDTWAQNREIIEIMLIPGQRPRWSCLRDIAYAYPEDLPVVTGDLVESVRALVREGHLGLKRSRWRVTTLDSAWGPVLILRRIDHLFSFQRYPEMRVRLERYLDCARRRYGVHLIVGPVGSGKSSLLSAFVRHLLEQGASLVVIEDPPEFDYGGALNQPGHLILIRGTVRKLAQPSVRKGILRMMETHDVVVGEIRRRDLPFLFEFAMTGKRIWATLHAVDVPGVWRMLKDRWGLEGIIETRLFRTPRGPVPALGILYLPEFQHLRQQPEQVLERWESATDLPISLATTYHLQQLQTGGWIAPGALDGMDASLMQGGTLIATRSRFPDAGQGMHFTIRDTAWSRTIHRLTGQTPPQLLSAEVLWEDAGPVLDGWFPESITRWRSMDYGGWHRFVTMLSSMVAEQTRDRRVRTINVVVLEDTRDSHDRH